MAKPQSMNVLYMLVPLICNYKLHEDRSKKNLTRMSEVSFYPIS